MGWKDGKKPEQYLFTITEEFSDNWRALKDKAKKEKNNISEDIQNVIIAICEELKIEKKYVDDVFLSLIHI